MAKKAVAKKARIKKAGPKIAAGAKPRSKKAVVNTSGVQQSGAGGRVATAPPAARPVDSGASSDVLDRLYAVVESRRGADPEISHSARLLARGTAKIAQKFGEEAVECLIEAVDRNPAALIGESADVLYHMLVMWLDAGVTPGEVWTELARREGISGIAEKASRVRKLSMSLPTRSTKIP